MQALHPVGFAEEQREQRFAVIYAGEPVKLGGTSCVLAQGAELATHAMGAQHARCAELPIRAFGIARDQVVENAFVQAVEPLLRDGVRNQQDGQPLAELVRARRGQQLLQRHAWQSGVEQDQVGGVGAGHSRQRGVGGGHHRDLGTGAEQHRLHAGQ